MTAISKQATSTGGDVVRFEQPRLPWSPAIEERFGELNVNKTTWRTIVEAVWPGAKTIDGVVLALSYCKARNLDPFKRPVHIVPVYNSALKRTVEGVWPGISELRTTAIRTGQYAGCDETEFGPPVTRTFAGYTTNFGGNHRSYPETTVTYPEWARCTVYRMIGGARAAFVGPKVRWDETYATAAREVDYPNEMWRKRPEGQLEKCAEAAALRRAFPEEIGNEQTAEEMFGRVIGDPIEPVTIQAVSRRLDADFSTPVEPEPEESQEADFTIEDEPEAQAEQSAEDNPADKLERAKARTEAVVEQAAGPAASAMEKFLDRLEASVKEAADVEGLEAVWRKSETNRAKAKERHPERMQSIEELFDERAMELTS